MNTQKIFELLAIKNITQNKFAKDLGISTGHLSDWKTQRSLPTTEKLILIANYFNVTTDYLLGLTDCPNIYEYITPKQQSNIPKELLDNWDNFDEIQKDMIMRTVDTCIFQLKTK